MKCPICGINGKDDYCDVCKENISYSYIKMAEEAENKGEYDKSIELLNAAKESTNEEKIIVEIEKKKKIIYLEKFDETTEIKQDKGDEPVKKKKSSSLGYIIPISVAVLLLSMFYFVPQIINLKKDKEVVFNLLPMNVPEKKEKDKIIQTMFVFNFTEGFYPYSDMADKWGYNRLIKTLLEYKNMTFTLSFTGTSLKALNWYAPETIELIKRGVREGQFKIAGSLYAYNVGLAVDKKMLKTEVEKGRETIEKMLGIIPDTFIWPEDTWNGEGLEIIKESGYVNIISEYGDAEDDNTINNKIVNGMGLYKIDRNFTDLVNCAVDTGDGYNNLYLWERGANLNNRRNEFKQLFKYIETQYRKDKIHDKILVFSNDADEFGVKDTILRRDGRWDAENLRIILNTINKTKWIKTGSNVKQDKSEKRTVAEYVNPKMNEYAVSKNPNYIDWIGFNKKSAVMRYYKDLFFSIENGLAKYENEESQNIKRLISIGEEVLLSHLSNFGTSRAPYDDDSYNYDVVYSIPEGVKEVFMIFEAIENIKNYKEQNYEKDINGDGIKEIVYVKNKNMYVFSKYRGGRLLAWYDLNDGEEIVGGEAAELYIDRVAYDINVAIYGNDSRPFLLDYERYYNGNIKTKKIVFEFARFLITDDKTRNYFDGKTYSVKQKGLNETVVYKNTAEDENSESRVFMSEMSCNISDDKIVFQNEDLVKSIGIKNDGLDINYNLKSEGKLIVENEFNIGYSRILEDGENSHKITREKEKIKLTEEKSGKKLEIEFRGKNDNKYSSSLFGTTVETVFYDKNSKLFIKNIKKD